MWHSVKKYRILIIVELLLFLLFLPACFAKEEMVYREEWEEAKASEPEEREYFSVSPGVYQVRVKAEVPEGAYVILRAEAEDGSFQAFRCNGITMEEGQKYADFEIYVLDSVEKAYIVREFGYAYSTVESVEIYKTNLGGRICCFCILIGSLLVNALLFYREKVLAGRISRQRQLAFWMLFLCVALSYFPYATDYYSFGADSPFHMLRIEGLKETLVNGGQFPVRVQSYWLYGHGYAVSTFYGDFFLFIPALLRLIGFSLMTSYKIFVLLVMAATAVVSYYALEKCTKRDSASLLGSVIYVLAPYRIYNVYNRGAVGEYVAMIFLPLVICGIYGLYAEQTDKKEYTKAKIPLIIGLSGILQCHLLTCEMTVFGILLVCAIMWKKTFRKQTFFQLLQAAIICLLLNCWFWLPLVQMLGMDTFWLHGLVDENIQYMGTLLAGVFQIWPNMGGYQTGMYNCEPIQIGIASLVLLVAYWILYFRKMVLGKKEDRQKNQYDKVTFFLGMASVLMVILSTSIFPWDALAKIPGLRFFVTALQFPTRLLSPASAFCAAFATFFLLWVQEEKIMGSEVRKGMYCLVLFLACFSGVYHVNNIAYDTSPTRLYNAENLGTMGVINGEYLLEGTVMEEYKFHDPIAEEGLEYYDYTKNGTNISVSVINHTDSQKYIELPIISYKGYKLDCTDETAKLPHIVDKAEGELNSHRDLKIAIPAGYSGELKISYKGFASYRVAEIISAVTLLCIGIYLVRGNFHRNFSSVGC